MFSIPKRKFLKGFFIIFVLSLLIRLWIYLHEPNAICITDFLRNEKECRPVCDEDSFSLPGMKTCHPKLSCLEIRRDVVITDEIIGNGAVKVVKYGLWKNYTVAVYVLLNPLFKSDFLSNVEMLETFKDEMAKKDSRVIQALGWCREDPVLLVTQYYPLSSADKVDTTFYEQLPQHDGLSARFNLCMDYVKILEMLHTHHQEKRIMCDSNTPQKTLSQILLTNDLRLVLADMDALPVVNMLTGTKCGEKELAGQFLAPEQLWPHENKPFQSHNMPGYDEKSDIWKLPDVCNYLLGSVPGGNVLRLSLFKVHTKCKSEIPSRRPSIKYIMSKYQLVQEKFKL